MQRVRSGDSLPNAEIPKGRRPFPFPGITIGKGDRFIFCFLNSGYAHLFFGFIAGMKRLDILTEKAVRRFLGMIADHYPIEGAVVFGSRARGTHRPDSDADVAVLLRGEHQRLITTKLQMADVAYDVLLETGVNISPLPVWMDEWEHPENSANPALLQAIVREGVRL